MAADEYYHQHRDPVYHHRGVVNLNFQLHDSLHFHCVVVVEFPLQLHSDLTKKHYSLQIEHHLHQFTEQADHIQYCNVSGRCISYGYVYKYYTLL